MRIIRFLIFYVLVSVLGVLALVFFGLNHYNVQIDLLEAQYTVSVAWVMAGAALFGFIVSMLLLGPGRLAAGWNSRALDREVRDLEGLLERREELRARLLAQHEALLERHERILLRHQALLDEHSHVVAERDEAVAQLTAARNARPAIAAGASGAATALRLLPQPKPQPQPQAQPQAQPMPASEPAATMPARAADAVPAAQVAQRTGIAAPAGIERPVAQQPTRPVAAQPAATVAPAPAPAATPAPAPAPATVPIVSTSSPPPSSPAASPSAANQSPAGKITRITEVTETPAPVAASVASQPQPQPQPQAAHEAQPRQRPRREPVLPKLRARAVHAREATAASVTHFGQRTQRGATNLRDTSGAWLTAQRNVQRERLARLRQRLASLRSDAK